jgi:hypothetical protein
MLVLFMWSSPFYLSWKIILVFILLYYLQLFLFGDCILIKGQFNTKKREMTIYTQILENFGLEVNRKTMVFISDYVFPWIIFFFALIWQVFR